MKNQNKTRRLTVSSIYQPRTCIEDKNVPMINLIGLWVENAGFKIGDKIAVDVEQNRLLINRIEPEIVQEVVTGKKKRSK
ncbi:Toxin SymE, type I toxin-antitoxin system [Chitinophaga ginsengisegetis]|uniref:Toxin SymE, type I toxin-antitoxin system n=1 Tax=Chitinophaga ginsengisegetis TaxID=393003 RepID=A0A1T5P9J4_9BACT|nr:SymE family type I addiction module toxin [Chitinophaga ginsengisegetis]SKD09425.1 Toxin SymE, type I toxin-antitoxin system [Chitinophaga ginsengisegetis]